MAKSRQKKSRFFRLTLWGKALLFFSAVILFAAFTTGRNVIYLLFSLIVSFMSVSAVLGTLSLCRLRVARLLPRHIFASRPFLVETSLTNEKRLFPSYSLVVSNVLNRKELEGRYILKLPASSSVSVAHKYLIERRGKYTFHGVKVTTAYPLGLFLEGYLAMQPETILVYPRLVQLNPHSFNAMVSEIENQVNRAGLGTDLHGFRKYQNGDDSRFINWKLSAKTRDLILNKYCHEQSLKVCVVFDNFMHRIDQVSREKFESAVSLAASLCSFFIERGFKVKFVSRNRQHAYCEGTEHLYRILRDLAVIEPTTGEDAAPDLYSPHILESGVGLLVYCEARPRRTGNFARVFDGANGEGT